MYMISVHDIMAMTKTKPFLFPMTTVNQRSGGWCKPVGRMGGPLSEPSAMSRQGKPFTAV